MQLQSLMIMLFMLFIVPIVILFTNPNIFFIILSIILFFVSLRNIHSTIYNISNEDDEPDDDMIEELEMALNIDMKKFSKGIKIVIDLIFILFFVYCIFSINSLWIRMIGGLVIFYWFMDISRVLCEKLNEIAEIFKPGLRNVAFVLINSFSIILITIAICNKFVRCII